MAGFVDAVETFRNLGARLDVAQTILQAVLALPDDPRVRTWESEARAIFDAVGASAWSRLLPPASTPQGAATATPAPTTEVLGRS